ncbi:anthranilate synthase / indole-3-glycerol phosphate synthase [Coemansia sp. RSA 1813]|nr:anthranilate synthase / indole-3-glycerol phosphate synthase [Coemansia sp. RSA 1646]KAJ1773762.1 anthranilate synthase / indole-3-glycerol phosphate synthase [Coemansia sp. RSA 1843]KAJ2093724.1 anthranilate synthase / indole-3-glycerol phosphate synthase [Coemansia sp. RSA 986]KAJ2217936.1 anthranilate synthase / indole-3-glycerol phosphate synthase [Coemansia sp. RSA 487]KAJ2573222.1 anthranilate synthase / indole-3-glycerol phosphate synthase [Coemansia sp. RSA 1813]
MQNSTQPYGVVAKVCGIGTVEAAEAAVLANADIIGLIFATSPRLIDMDTAKAIAQTVRAHEKDTSTPEIVATIPSLCTDTEEQLDTAAYFVECANRILQRRHELGRPLIAGVFQNQDAEHVARIARSVPLDLVQLHGTEPPEMAQLISVPVIKVFHVDDSFSVDDTNDMLRRRCHSLILLDTKVAGTAQQGGRGVQFDWNIARALADKGVPFVMAGGLTPDNVEQAVAIGRPWGVDVSSGIETDRTKDPAKIHAFVRNSKTSLSSTM